MSATVKELSLSTVRHVADPNGTLAVMEAPRDVPFEIKRLFYVYGVHAGDVRGQHAHKRASQLLVCVRGRCEVLCDDGREKKTFVLDAPTKSLLVPPGVWAQETYAMAATILLVLSDRPYEEDDYIRDYGAFLEHRGAAAPKR